MSEQIITKRCTKCKKIKRITEFYHQKSHKDGYASWCKLCKDKVVKQYLDSENGKITRNRYEQSEHYKNRMKISYKKYNNTQKGKERAHHAQKKYYWSNQDKIKAHRAVNNAIQAGKLKKTSSYQCQYCPAQAEQYHHYLGYESKHWFDIIPLCKKCHRQQHKIIP